MRKKVRIGTRKSMLALTQSTMIKKAIEARYPDCEVELVKIVTKGDKILDVPLAKVGGKGLFVKEIEEAMLRDEIDIAVHSMKDVPAELPDELFIGVVAKREDPRDAFLSVKYGSIDELPEGAKIGTSSLRRRSQLARIRPDLVIEDLRGNLDTRLRKLDDGLYDAIILATAGLNRMGWDDRITAHIDTGTMLPAVAQGAVGIEMRRNDAEIIEGLAFLNHADTSIAVACERAFLHTLEGGCQVPIGGHATVENGRVRMTGLIASVAGDRFFREDIEGLVEEAEATGRALAEKLLGQGGAEVLAEVYEQG